MVPSTGGARMKCAMHWASCCCALMPATPSTLIFAGNPTHQETPHVRHALRPTTGDPQPMHLLCQDALQADSHAPINPLACGIYCYPRCG